MVSEEVGATGGALAAAERGELLARIEAGMNVTAAGFKKSMPLVAGLFFVMAVMMVFKGSWSIAALVAAFGGLMAFIGVAAARRTAPERMKPVLDALRDAPEQVTLVRHYQTSDSLRLFVTDWIEVKTAESRLLIKAKDDWHGLLDQLTRHCPQATIKHK